MFWVFNVRVISVGYDRIVVCETRCVVCCLVLLFLLLRYRLYLVRTKYASDNAVCIGNMTALLCHGILNRTKIPLYCIVLEAAQFDRP